MEGWIVRLSRLHPPRYCLGISHLNNHIVQGQALGANAAEEALREFRLGPPFEHEAMRHDDRGDLKGKKW